MPFHDQKILPAARSLKQFEYIVLLEAHVGNLKKLKTEAANMERSNDPSRFDSRIENG